jgi:sensor histidine kinase regulating citrate/malate metabolism
MSLLFRVWILLSICLTLLISAVYVGIQQLNRLSENEPLVQIATEVANSLENDQETNLSLPIIDIQKSQSLFVILYDSEQQPIKYNAKLGQNPAFPPIGILESAKQYGENRVTWQPAKGLRFATVTVYYNGTKSGYVLVGKSLTEAEYRIDMIGQVIFLIWLLSMVVTFLVTLLLSLRYEEASNLQLDKE